MKPKLQRGRTGVPTGPVDVKNGLPELTLNLPVSITPATAFRSAGPALQPQIQTQNKAQVQTQVQAKVKDQVQAQTKAQVQTQTKAQVQTQSQAQPLTLKPSKFQPPSPQVSSPQAPLTPLTPSLRARTPSPGPVVPRPAPQAALPSSASPITPRLSSRSPARETSRESPSRSVPTTPTKLTPRLSRSASFSSLHDSLPGSPGTWSPVNLTPLSPFSRNSSPYRSPSPGLPSAHFTPSESPNRSPTRETKKSVVTPTLHRERVAATPSAEDFKKAINLELEQLAQERELEEKKAEHRASRPKPPSLETEVAKKGELTKTPLTPTETIVPPANDKATIYIPIKTKRSPHLVAPNKAEKGKTGETPVNLTTLGLSMVATTVPATEVLTPGTSVPYATYAKTETPERVAVEVPAPKEPEKTHVESTPKSPRRSLTPRLTRATADVPPPPPKRRKEHKARPQVPIFVETPNVPKSLDSVAATPVDSSHPELLNLATDKIEKSEPLVGIMLSEEELAERLRDHVYVNPSDYHLLAAGDVIAYLNRKGKLMYDIVIKQKKVTKTNHVPCWILEMIFTSKRSLKYYLPLSSPQKVWKRIRLDTTLLAQGIDLNTDDIRDLFEYMEQKFGDEFRHFIEYKRSLRKPRPVPGQPVTKPA